MHNMTKARVQKIIQEKEQIIKELDVLEKTTLTTMWLRELEQFSQEYMKYKNAREKISAESVIESNGSQTKSKTKKVSPKTKK